MMTSWRDSASPKTQHDLDELLGASLGFAQQQLASHGTFYPYAVAVSLDGQTEMIAARPDIHDDQPATAAVIASCLATLADRRDQLLAAAVVADVHIPDPGSDAIQVCLEHAEGPALTVLLTYTKQGSRNAIEYGSLSASAGNRRIWPN